VAQERCQRTEIGGSESWRQLRPQRMCTRPDWFDRGQESTLRFRDVAEPAFERLAPLWPRGVGIRDLLSDPASHLEDLRLLYRHGLIELRLIEPDERTPPSGPLHALEVGSGYATTPYHTWVMLPAL